MILLVMVPAFAGETATNDFWAGFTQRIANGFDQTVAGLKVVLGIFVGGIVLLFLTGGGKKRAKAKKKGGPLGGFHVTEAMILDKHYDDPVARHGARWVRDKFFG